MNLDTFQKKAAMQDSSHSAIIAGAGTGKTYTLLGRIQYLIQQKGFLPEEILVISYTNESVNDFTKKAKNKLGISIKVLTFHKLAMEVLKLANFEFYICPPNELEFIIHEFFASYILSNKSLYHLLLNIFSFNQRISLRKKCILSNNPNIEKLKKDITSFIYFCQSKGYDTAFLNKVNGKSIHQKSFLNLVIIIMELYKSEKRSQSKLDFDDLILFATNKLYNIEHFPFRHILVDEFQDSSPIRISFLTSLIKHFNVEFTVVGDDCQSIYRFSGTESNCFASLQSSFPKMEYFYLKYTYRNSQQLIEIANSFITKNPKQIKKEIMSSSFLEYPIEVLFYSNLNINKIMDYILSQIDGTIMFLSRNSFDLQYYFSNQEIIWLNDKEFSLKQYPGYEFLFLTVHRSKGLEADYIILLHMENSTYGFPNKIINSKYIPQLLDKDNILFEEERRLFYVALTRTKNKIFILAPYNKSSIFIKELLKDYSSKIKVLYF